MNWLDWGIGAVTIAASMLIDRFLAGRPGGSLPDGWRALAGDALKKAILGPGESLPSFLLKNGLAVATGLARMGLTDGPVSFNITLGDTYFENQVGLSRDASGNYSGGFTNRIGNVSSAATTQDVSQTVDTPTSSSTDKQSWGGLL
jgi:hypothetical protein